MRTRISILALTTVFILMTGCAYHEYNGRGSGHYRNGDHHQSATNQKHRQHRYEYRNYERDDHRRPDREDSKRHSR